MKRDKILTERTGRLHLETNVFTWTAGHEEKRASLRAAT